MATRPCHHELVYEWAIGVASATEDPVFMKLGIRDNICPDIQMTKEVEKLLGLVLFHTGELVFGIVDDVEPRPPDADFGFPKKTVAGRELAGRHRNGHQSRVNFDVGPMCCHEPFKNQGRVCSRRLGVGHDSF